MSEKNLGRVKRTVYTLIVLSVITFLSGFLKYTRFEFVGYILFFLLFIGGVKLIVMTSKTKATGKISRGFLLLTGVSTILFMLLMVIGLLISMQSGIHFRDSLELLEGLFYLNSLLFLIGAIGSTVMLWGQNEKKS